LLASGVATGIHRLRIREVSKQNFWPAKKGLFLEGAGRRIRTDDLLITNQLLYQLSYAGIFTGKIA
jgi:hypothetical protein